VGSETPSRLPALARPSAEVVPPNGLPHELARRRILVVDDNVDAAISLARVLKRLYGQEVRVAHYVLSALEMVGTFLQELMILDIGMPGMDGYELARRLRGRTGTCSAYLVVP
jgi:CheY-like chemotaxis protein